MTSRFIIQSFDRARIPLSEWARSSLGIRSLELLHLRSDLIALSKYNAMCICREELKDNAARLKTMLEDLFSLSIVPLVGCVQNAFQMPPTFRVHLDGSGTVSELHRDRDYGMPSTRRTAWVPLTNVWGNNSLWVEDAGSMKPVELEYGQFIIFDSSSLLHGSVTNDTGTTRVSFDCRFIPRTPV